MGECVRGVVGSKLKSGTPSLIDPSRSLYCLAQGMPGNTVRYLELKNTNHSNCLKKEVSTQTKMG